MKVNYHLELVQLKVFQKLINLKYHNKLHPSRTTFLFQIPSLTTSKNCLHSAAMAARKKTNNKNTKNKKRLISSKWPRVSTSSTR